MEDSTKGRINLHDSFFNIPYSFFISPQGLCSFESLLRKQSLKRQIERLFSFCPKTVRRFAVCGKRIQMVSDGPAPGSAPLGRRIPIYGSSSFSNGRFDRRENQPAFFIIQYSIFILHFPQGQIPSVFAKQNSGRPVWPLRGDLGRSKTCRLPRIHSVGFVSTA